MTAEVCPDCRSVRADQANFNQIGNAITASNAHVAKDPLQDPPSVCWSGTDNPTLMLAPITIAVE
ncbi:unknown protein [Paenibacillus amylolyticus]|uniref:Peptidase C9 domain-containing protein n=1 Tax=Paenibacillus amylolyticus TaxID=1451 RepID=A0A124DYD1_PAEAM|nr:unknown protein [Paenibacillus amylolyticus]